MPHKSAALSDKDRLVYLERYHEITQHYMGIASLSMTEEQLAKVQKYKDQLDVLFIHRLLALGIPYDALGTFNNYTPEELDRLGIDRPITPTEAS